MLRQCLSNVTENIYVKIYDFVQDKFVAFNVSQDITCSCKCKYSKNVCRPEQTWNKSLCRCEPFIIPDKIKEDKISVDEECTSTVTTKTPSTSASTNVPYIHKTKQKKCDCSGMIVLIVLFCLTGAAMAILLKVYFSLKRKMITNISSN